MRNAGSPLPAFAGDRLRGDDRTFFNDLLGRSDRLEMDIAATTQLTGKTSQLEITCRIKSQNRVKNKIKIKNKNRIKIRNKT